MSSIFLLVCIVLRSGACLLISDTMILFMRNPFRHSLPAYQMKKEIVTTIAENQVTVVSGDTGCGKV